MSQKALVVEDEVGIADLIQELLEGDGFSARVARDGITAETLVEGEDFEIYVIDLNLPGCSGLEVINKIRQKKEQAPIIVQSGYLEDPVYRNLSLKPSTFVLSKPWTPDALRAVFHAAAALSYCSNQVDGKVIGQVRRVVSQFREPQELPFVSRSRELSVLADSLMGFPGLSESLRAAAKLLVELPGVIGGGRYLRYRNGTYVGVADSLEELDKLDPIAQGEDEGSVTIDLRQSDPEFRLPRPLSVHAWRAK